YKAASIALAQKTVTQYTDNLLAIHLKIEQESDKKLQLNGRMAETEALLEQHKTVLVNREKLLSSRQRELNEHVNKIRQLESDKKIKNERLRYLEDRAQYHRCQLQMVSQS